MQYLRITKLPIMALFLVTSLAAMQLAGRPSPARIVAVLAAIALTVAGSAALNNYLERGPDARMERTRRRPTASGVLPPGRALAFGLAVTVVGVAAVLALAGPTAAVFAAAGAFYYAVVYTLLLKPRLALSTVPGALAGAFPAMVGWAATGAAWSAEILCLCAVIIVWTPPHFWALALARWEDYQIAGFPSPAERYGQRGARLLILAAAVVLVAVTLAAGLLGPFGPVYTVVAAVTGLAFLSLAVRLVVRPSDDAAWLLHKLSGPYLGVLVLVMALDGLW